MRKNYVPTFPVGFNHPVLLNVNNRSKELRWLARGGMFFTKRVLVVQTINICCIICENPGGPRPMVDNIVKAYWWQN